MHPRLGGGGAGVEDVRALQGVRRAAGGRDPDRCGRGCGMPVSFEPPAPSPDADPGRAHWQPPPPPGSTSPAYYDPARRPPPPPSVTKAAFELFVRKEILPRTTAICSGEAGEGSVHQAICREFATFLGTWQAVPFVGIRAP